MIAEQDKQKILAANLERDHISTNIQSEVTATLNSVIDQTISGLRMLDEAKHTVKSPRRNRSRLRSRPSEVRGVKHWPYAPTAAGTARDRIQR